MFKNCVFNIVLNSNNIERKNEIESIKGDLEIIKKMLSKQLKQNELILQIKAKNEC